MANGVARKVDQLGRVVIPVEMRKALRIDVGDLVMMSAEQDRIVLEKVETALRVLRIGRSAARLQPQGGLRLMCGATHRALSRTARA